MARGCRPSPARAGMAVQKEADAQGAGQIVTPIGGLPCTGIVSMAGRLLLHFEKFHPHPSAFIMEEDENFQNVEVTRQPC